MTPERRALIGRSSWILLHTLVYSIHTPQDLARYKSFAFQLLHLYPCSSCRRNIFRMHREWLLRLARLRIAHPEDQDGAALWAFAFHDAVSRALGKTIEPAWDPALLSPRAILALLRRTYEGDSACIL